MNNNASYTSLSMHDTRVKSTEDSVESLTCFIKFDDDLQ